MGFAFRRLFQETYGKWKPWAVLTMAAVQSVIPILLLLNLPDDPKDRSGQLGVVVFFAIFPTINVLRAIFRKWDNDWRWRKHIDPESLPGTPPPRPARIDLMESSYAASIARAAASAAPAMPSGPVTLRVTTSLGEVYDQPSAAMFHDLLVDLVTGEHGVESFTVDKFGAPSGPSSMRAAITKAGIWIECQAGPSVSPVGTYAPDPKVGTEAFSCWAFDQGTWPATLAWEPVPSH